MTDRKIDITRRSVLASIGAIGVAGAAAGLGTSALFSDEESFGGSTMAAGELNLRVDWQEHYYNGLGEAAAIESLRFVDDETDVVDEEEVGLPDPRHPLVAVHESDVDQFMTDTTLEQSGPVDDPSEGLVVLNDVKPGDFGELTLSYHLSDNPAYVTLCAERVADAENDLTEPEEDLGDDGPAGELGDEIQAVVWYDSNCNNLRDPDDANVVAQGSLNEVLGALGSGQEDGCRRLDPAQSGGTVSTEFGGNCHAPWGGGAGACEETLYLTDSGPDGTSLFEVTLSGGQAHLDLIESLPAPQFDQVDAIAATPDGGTIHVIDKNSGHLGEYDIVNDGFTDAGPLSNTDGGSFPGGTVMAAYSPDGVLYMASSVTDGLYTVDPSAVTFTQVATIQESLRGTDITFTVDGTLYLISTEDSNGKALYTVDPADGSVEKQGDGTGKLFTGLGVRAAGTGNLVGSATSDNSIYIIGRDGSLGTQYPMVEGGELYEYDFGDMTVGELCTDRPSGHCVALAWWLPRDVGNIVQSDRYEFNIGFLAEQCRNNDDPPGYVSAE